VPLLDEGVIGSGGGVILSFLQAERLNNPMNSRKKKPFVIFILFKVYECGMHF
jgi:hypothetical protein